jgi:hypothetical protein
MQALLSPPVCRSVAGPIYSIAAPRCRACVTQPLVCTALTLFLDAHLRAALCRRGRRGGRRLRGGGGRNARLWVGPDQRAAGVTLHRAGPLRWQTVAIEAGPPGRPPSCSASRARARLRGRWLRGPPRLFAGPPVRLWRLGDGERGTMAVHLLLLPQYFSRAGRVGCVHARACARRSCAVAGRLELGTGEVPHALHNGLLAVPRCPRPASLHVLFMGVGACVSHAPLGSAASRACLCPAGLIAGRPRAAALPLLF